MPTPLYRRGGVGENLTDVISFYEDVTQQMKNAYDDLYQKLIIVGERLNTTVQTLEKTNNEKEKLLQQNEYLINEIDKEPINLGSTHILHNILCNKAEAYKVLKEHENRQMEKSSNVSAADNNDKEDDSNENDKKNEREYDADSTVENGNDIGADNNSKCGDKLSDNNDQTKTEKTSEREIQVKHEYFKIEDLLNTWKNKFENPVVNVTLNVTSVPKAATKCNFLKNRSFTSWQDELVYYVHGESTSSVKLAENGNINMVSPKQEENNKTVNEQRTLEREEVDNINKQLPIQKEQNNETVCEEGTVDRNESVIPNNQLQVEKCVKYSKNMEMEEQAQPENDKNLKICEETSSHQTYEGVSLFLRTNPIDSNKNTCSIEKYDELQFSDSSENSENLRNPTEKCINKLSKENKMLNAILSQKKRAYAEVFENHVQGSSYEVFQRLQSMENIQNMQNMKTANTPTEFDSITFQKLHKKGFIEVDPINSNDTHVSLISPTTASTVALNGIHTVVPNSEQSDTDQRNAYASYSERFNPCTKNQRQCVDITNAQNDAKHGSEYASYSEHLHPCSLNQRKTFVDISNEQKTEDFFHPNKVEREEISVRHDAETNKNILADVNTQTSDIKINNEKSISETSVFAQNVRSNLSNTGSSIYNNSKIYEDGVAYFPNYNDVQRKINRFNNKQINGESQVQLTPNFFFSHEPSGNSQNYNFTNFSNVPDIKIWKPLNYYAGVSSHNNLFEPCESIHNKSIYPNYIGNLRQFCKYNNNKTTMQNYYNGVPQEITNDGDTVFFGSASTYEPTHLHLRGSSETLKNSFSHSNCNCFADRFYLLNGNTQKCSYYKSPFGSNINCVYNANKMLHKGAQHLLRDISTHINVKNEKINQKMKKKKQIKVINQKTNAHFQKAEINRNKRKTRNKGKSKKKVSTNYNTNQSNDHSECHNHTPSNSMHMEHSNSGTDGDDDGYSDEKGNDSSSNYDSDSTFSGFCKIVNSENIQSNNLSSNYIDMDFDKRLLPYYTEDDSIIPFSSDINGIQDEPRKKNRRINKGKNNKKRKREHTSDSGCKKKNILPNFHSNSSYSSDGFVSLNSCIGTNALSSEGETYHFNSVSSLKNDRDIETRSRTNISSYKQINIRSTNTKTSINCIHRKNSPKKMKRKTAHSPSNEISCISVCGSYSREEEIKTIISDQEKNAETVKEIEINIERPIDGNMKKKHIYMYNGQAEKKTQKKNDTQEKLNDYQTAVLNTIIPLKSVKVVKDTKIKQTIKGTKRIRTTGPSKNEENIQNMKENKKTPITIPLQNKTKEITSNQHNNTPRSGEPNNTTPKNTFCYTSNEASFKTSLETIVSTLVETINDTSNTPDFENVRTDKYELRAKKKITYVMPSIKRKLRRDGARRIFDPFLYNTMWKINN